MNEIILEKSTIHGLKSNTNVFFDTPRDEKSRQVVVSDIKYIEVVNNKELQVRAKTRTKSNTYDTSIVFTNVTFLEKDDKRSKTQVFGANGQYYYLVPIKKNITDVKVACTCLDFYYMFSIWNHRDGSLDGDAPKPYIKTTDRPLRNPQRVEGICKHILRLSDELIRVGILK